MASFLTTIIHLGRHSYGLRSVYIITLTTHTGTCKALSHVLPFLALLLLSMAVLEERAMEESKAKEPTTKNDAEAIANVNAKAIANVDAMAT